jgi:hypothetical protein
LEVHEDILRLHLGPVFFARDLANGHLRHPVQRANRVDLSWGISKAKTPFVYDRALTS